MDSKKLPYSIFSLIHFLLLETFLYLCFLAIDLGFFPYENISSVFKLSGIFLCVLFALNNKSYKSAFILFLTSCADIFLLFSNRYVPGIMLFYAIQYSYHKTLFPGRRLAPFCLLTGAVSIFTPLLIYKGFSADISLILAAAYFIFLLYNSILVLFYLKKKTKGEMLFAFGLVLLLFCDIQVGIYNAAAYLPKETVSIPIFFILNRFAANGMWFCYLPSQVFITMALLELTGKKSCT